MSGLLPALGSLLLFVVFTAAFIGASLQFGQVPDRLRRILFTVGIPGTPIFVLALVASGLLSVSLGFSLSLFAVFAQALALPFLGVRRQSGSRRQHVRRLRVDTVLYASSSVLWFTLVYWTGSAVGIEGLHFKVESAVASGTPDLCLSAPALLCSHLSFVEALHYSAGNLLTLGAAGITPLEEFTRFLAILQLEPVFVTAYVLARS